MNQQDTKVHVLICLVVCSTIFGCLRYYVACTVLVRALEYCNFLKEIRLGDWGTEGSKAPTLGQCIRVCVPPFC